jgi:hypothetical protein
MTFARGKLTKSRVGEREKRGVKKGKSVAGKIRAAAGGKEDEEITVEDSASGA